jgi:hypothetical protein
LTRVMTDTGGPVSSANRLPFADPEFARRTPGEEFALAVSRWRGLGDTDEEVVVPLRVALPATFPAAATRPRYSVRQLLKISSVDQDGLVPYVGERPFSGGPIPAGPPPGAVPAAGFTATVQRAGLTELSVGVPAPAGLLDEPALLAEFVDHRVVARLCGVEDAALLHGTADGLVDGLLRVGGLSRDRLGDDLAAAITAGAAALEETGGTCDGVILNPAGYWQLVRDGLLDRLTDAGVRVCRTAMIEPDQVLLADFRAAATLLDPAASTLALRAAAGPDGADLIEARTGIGLAVQLPHRLLLLTR